jgi:hypothetical protein
MEIYVALKETAHKSSKSIQPAIFCNISCMPGEIILSDLAEESVKDFL